MQEKQEREEVERKQRIQLYVFVLRSIAYTFNAKPPTDMQKRHLKVTREGHDKIKAKIEVGCSFLFGRIGRKNVKLFCVLAFSLPRER